MFNSWGRSWGKPSAWGASWGVEPVQTGNKGTLHAKGKRRKVKHLRYSDLTEIEQKAVAIAHASAPIKEPDYSEDDTILLALVSRLLH